MQADVVDQNNKKVRAIKIDKMTEEKLNKAVLYYAVKAKRTNLRHGTVKTKTRSEVNMTNKKIYRQKGTGNARHGPRSANIFVGGGNVHGPRPRVFAEKMNKKAQAASYRETLRYLLQNNQLKLVEEFKFAKPSTKMAAKFLKDLGFSKAMIYVPAPQNGVPVSGTENAARSFRNLRDVKVAWENNLNLFDMLRYENTVLTAGFFEKLKERYGL